jgi:hypothetical protein
MKTPISAQAQIAQAAKPHVAVTQPVVAPRQQSIPSLIVMNARGAALQNGKLTLTGVSPNSIVFADRPVRAAGHMQTQNLLAEWSPSQSDRDSFAKSAPNATVSVLGKDGTVRDAVVVLKTASAAGEVVTFDVDVLQGNLSGADGAASIFIDRFGFRGGFHGGGFGHAHFGGGGWHHGWGRGWGPGSGAAAAMTGVALGAAAASGPAYYPAPAYVPPACGYYPYPPCY